MKAVALFVCLTAGCGADVEPPFTFRVVEHDEAVNAMVLELAFENYSTARTSGPHQVEISDAGTTGIVDLAIGRCAEVPCTGPVALEELHVRLTPGPFSSDQVFAYACVGLDGGHEFQGIDGTGAGACE